VSTHLGRPRGRIRPTRAARQDWRRRRHSFVGLVAACVLIVVVLVWLVDASDDSVVGSSPSATATAAGKGASDLVALSITGAPHALLAVIGANGAQDPAAVVLPPQLTIVVPGQGETTTDSVADLSGDSMRIAASNAVGAWAGRYAVTDLNHFEDMLDRIGGLTLDLPHAYTVGSDVLGAGKTELSPSQLVTFLYEPGEDAGARWRLVLRGFLASSPDVEPGDLLESDDPSGVMATVADASGAQVVIPPIRLSAGGVLVPSQPEFDQMIASLFGTLEPVKVVVQNGNGIPGIGEVIARRIIPEGFRVILSQNAESFDHDTTEVIATGTEHQADAERAQEAIGVGEVLVSEVPSGFTDITIVVGKDFSV
jgi:LytR cell envelope-related transcriptional attenuator